MLKKHSGVTLIETIFFLLVVSIALVVLIRVFSDGVNQSVDPVVRVRALELAQAQLDEILSRKFDENTPTGGIPACDTGVGVACLGIVPDADFDDVGDYNGFADNTDPDYSIAVTVVNAGVDLLLPAAQARLISVTVSIPVLHSSLAGSSVTLSAYKVNF